MDSPKLKPKARHLIENPSNQLAFSAASIWEVAIKNGIARSGVVVDPAVLRQGLIDAGFDELSITALHALATQSLPMIHSDPFDRLLIAQASSEGATLLTSDRLVASYPGPITRI